MFDNSKNSFPTAITDNYFLIYTPQQWYEMVDLKRYGGKRDGQFLLNFYI